MMRAVVLFSLSLALFVGAETTINEKASVGSVRDASATGNGNGIADKSMVKKVSASTGEQSSDSLRAGAGDIGSDSGYFSQWSKKISDLTKWGSSHSLDETVSNEGAYWRVFQYAFEPMCEDGDEPGDYLMSFSGKSGECTSITDGRYGVVTCSEDGETWSMTYYQDENCEQRLAVFADNDPTDTCLQINSKTWKAIASPDEFNSDTTECFAGTERVLTEDGRTVAMEDVKLGDRVQVASSAGSLDFADVVFLPHRANTVETLFVQLETTRGSLKVTPDHLILAGDCGDDASLISAKDISVGSCISSISGPQHVISVTEMKSKGIYSLVTSHGDGIIVVNGFKASSFGPFHMLPNMYYQLHRSLYNYMPIMTQVLHKLNEIVSPVATLICAS